MAVKLALVGAGGRMGTRIDALAATSVGVMVVARFHRENMDQYALAGNAEVIIDFSSEHGTRAAIEIARKSGAALLVGTTGLSNEVIENLRALSASNAVIVSPNTSLGVAVTRRLARLAAELLAVRLVGRHR